MATETKNIAANDDDGYDSFGSFFSDNGSGNLICGAVFGTPHTAGLRFTGFSASLQGATVSSATLTIQISNVNGSPDLNVFGEDADSAAAWSSSRFPSSITKTTASTNITPTATGSLDIDVTSIVQEIIDRGSWASDIAFGIFDNVGGTGSHTLTIDAFEKAGGTPASLEVVYTTGGGGTTVPIFYRHYRRMKI